MILVINNDIASTQVSSLARMDNILPPQPDGPGDAPLSLSSNIFFVSVVVRALIIGALLGRQGKVDEEGSRGCNAFSVCCISGRLVFNNVALDAKVNAARLR